MLGLSAAIWALPLSDSERAIIESRITGDHPDVQKWLRHLLAVYDANMAAKGR